MSTGTRSIARRKTTASPDSTGSQRKSGSRKSSQKKSLEATFQSALLEASFISFSQLTNSHLDGEIPLETRIKRRLRSEIEFIGNPEFSAADAETAILGDEVLASHMLQPSKPVKLPDLPSHLKRMCERRLLLPEEEKILFQRMNFLRFKAQSLRSQLSATSTEWDLIRIQSLLNAANWHRDLIVRSNMRLVMSIVKKFVNSSNGFDDLLSDGTVALMRAVDKFDFDRGFRFSTYATQVVRRNAYRTVMQRQNDKLRTAVSTQDPGVDVCDEERTGIDEHRWQLLRSRLALMLDQLDRREKLIIRARFSLGGHRRVQTLQRLADVLGVSKERVRQIEKRALDKLRGLVEKSPALEVESAE